MIDLGPDHAPEAVQAVAFVAVHAIVDMLPLTTELGLACSETVGAGDFTETDADWLALPPGPVHVSVKVEFVVTAPVEA